MTENYHLDLPNTPWPAINTWNAPIFGTFYRVGPPALPIATGWRPTKAGALRAAIGIAANHVVWQGTLRRVQ